MLSPARHFIECGRNGREGMIASLKGMALQMVSENYPRPPRPGATRQHMVRGGNGFTLLELLLVITLIALLAAMLLPALNRGKSSAQQIRCMSNLHQLSIATHLYWDDNSGTCFRYGGVLTNQGQLYWFGWIANGAEGDRAFDLAQGALFNYLRGRGIELCPSFNYTSPQFKLKAKGASYGYGYNLYLSAPPQKPAVRTSRILNPAQTALMADAAQVNTWQAP